MHKRLLAAWCAVALGAAMPVAARSSAPTHVVYVTALSQDGRLLSGLTADDFAVFEDGSAREVIAAEAGPRPVAVAATVELFGLGVPNAIAAARGLERALGPDDRAWLSNLTSPGMLSPQAQFMSGLIPRSIESVSVLDGLHAVLSAMSRMNASLALLAITAPPQSRPMNFDDPTDGAVRSPRVEHSSKDVEKLAIPSGVAVYGLSVKGSTTDRQLKEITETTGGGFVTVAGSNDLGAPIAAMLNELRHRYRLTFSITQPDGKTHDLRLQSKRQDVRLVGPRKFVSASTVYH